MDERIMDMVSLIADQVRTRQELFSLEGEIVDSLMSSGYRLHEADAALMFMQDLARDVRDGGPAGRGAMRSMSTEERSRFTIEAFSFLAKLAQLGVITTDQREEIVDTALAAHRGRIGIEEVRSLLARDLFSDIREDVEEDISGPDDRPATAWN